MKSTVVIFQVFLALALITTILLQARGSGLGKAWGASGTSYHSKRGMEKILFLVTIAIAFLFLLISILNLIMK